MCVCLCVRVRARESPRMNTCRRDSCYFFGAGSKWKEFYLSDSALFFFCVVFVLLGFLGLSICFLLAFKDFSGFTRRNISLFSKFSFSQDQGKRAEEQSTSDFDNRIAGLGFPAAKCFGTAHCANPASPIRFVFSMCLCGLQAVLQLIRRTSQTSSVSLPTWR